VSLIYPGFPLPTSLVVSANGSNAPVILDGSGSSDPDMDALNYSWSLSQHFFCDVTRKTGPKFLGQIEPPPPFAAGVIVTQVFGLGSEILQLEVSDCLETATTDLCFAVAPVSYVLGLFVRIVDASPVPRQDAKVLIYTLNSANESFSAGKVGRAVNHLQNFQNKVQSHVTDAVLAWNWVQAAQAVIDGILFQPP